MAPLTLAALWDLGFRCLGRDIYGYVVFQLPRRDGRFWRVVYPGFHGDTPVFIGSARSWTLADTLNWPVLRSPEGVYLLPPS